MKVKYSFFPSYQDSKILFLDALCESKNKGAQFAKLYLIGKVYSVNFSRPCYSKSSLKVVL